MKQANELPDPFLFQNGRRVRTAANWRERRAEILSLIVEIEYGGLPPAPRETRFEPLHEARPKRFGGARFITGRVIMDDGQPYSFILQLLIPRGDGPFPVVLNGDGCWWYATDDVVEEILRFGNIFAKFNRVEIFPDTPENAGRKSRFDLRNVYPDRPFGALAAWAWGYHRCVDALLTMDFADRGRIAIVGHSRGGKTTLLAGATDERIALTCANCSGAGGAGCFRVQGPGAETLADLLRAVPYWFGPKLQDFISREQEMPFDQHFLKALVAPRLLLTTEALGDLWANPAGTWQTHLAAREVYRFLGAEERIGIRFRAGEHEHNAADWRDFLEFMAWQLRGKTEYAQKFKTNPHPAEPPAFSWSAPER